MPSNASTDLPPDPARERLRTPLCERLGCRHPLILAGMGGVARAELVTAVTRAGAFGFLGMVREPVALIRDEVAQVRRHTDRPFGVNLIPAATDPGLLAQQVDTCIALRVPVVGLFWDVFPDVIARLVAAGIFVVHQVGSVMDAHRAQEAGAGALIVQGIEAGGHVRGLRPLAERLAEVLAVAAVPVAAAGGLADGRDVARVLAQGAQAAVLGTALAATHESFAHDYHKQRLVSAHAADTVLTEVFHLNWPPRALVRVLANSVTRGEHGSAFTGTRTVIGDEQGRPIHRFSTDSPLRSMHGDFESMALYAGLGVERIHGLEPAGQRIARIVAEATAQARNGDDTEGALPLAGQPCADAAGAAAQRQDVLARLEALLEAERAGARVTLRSAAETQDPTLRALIESIHHDEVRWCVMLGRAIRHLDGTPSTRTGAFYDKAMAIHDLPERMIFLNRGQSWVVRKLRELLPRMDEPGIRRDLADMLHAHEANIERVDVLLDAPS